MLLVTFFFVSSSCCCGKLTQVTVQCGPGGERTRYYKLDRLWVCDLLFFIPLPSPSPLPFGLYCWLSSYGSTETCCLWLNAHCSVQFLHNHREPASYHLCSSFVQLVGGCFSPMAGCHFCDSVFPAQSWRPQLWHCLSWGPHSMETLLQLSHKQGEEESHVTPQLEGNTVLLGQQMLHVQ